MSDKRKAASGIIEQFQFPLEHNHSISDADVRKAIWEAFRGRCFYTAQPVPLLEASIDHVVPRSLGGPDNIFNYVLTTKPRNTLKSARFDPIGATAALALVRTVYAPRVLTRLSRARQVRHERQLQIGIRRHTRQRRSAPAIPAWPLLRWQQKRLWMYDFWRLVHQLIQSPNENLHTSPGGTVSICMSNDDWRRHVDWSDLDANLLVQGGSLECVYYEPWGASEPYAVFLLTGYMVFREAEQQSLDDPAQVRCDDESSLSQDLMDRYQSELAKRFPTINVTDCMEVQMSVVGYSLLKTFSSDDDLIQSLDRGWFLDARRDEAATAAEKDN